jgi:hypothetical protein
MAVDDGSVHVRNEVWLASLAADSFSLPGQKDFFVLLVCYGAVLPPAFVDAGLQVLQRSLQPSVL